VNTRRVALTGVAVFAAAGLAVAGCTGGNSTSASASGSASASASAVATGTGTGGSSTDRDALLSSIDPLTRTTYKYSLTSGGLTGQGANDPANKAATLSLTGTGNANGQSLNSLTVNVVALGTDVWMKLAAGTANNNVLLTGDKWFHIDATRLGANPSLPVDPNGGANAAALLRNAVTVQRTDAHHFTGTVDLTNGTLNMTIGQAQLNQLGAKAKAVPFTASTDDQNRLASVTLDLASVDQNVPAVAVTYSGYGDPVSVTRPDPAQVQEAPNGLYDLFKQ
jgi:hypothetical protein